MPQNGVYPTELQWWKENATAALSEAPEERVTAQQSRDAKKRIKELERDVRRKDKASRRDDSAVGAVKEIRGDLAARRGRMIALEDRQRTAQWLEAACRDGARFKLACEVAGINARTVQRWKAGDGWNVVMVVR